MNGFSDQTFLPYTQKTAGGAERSTISSMLSYLSNNSKDVYDLFSVVAKALRSKNSNEENDDDPQQQMDLLKSQLMGRIQEIISSFGDSSNLLFNGSSST